MAKHPEVQEKAREEILSITGDHRLPTLADKPALVYLLAVLKVRILLLSPKNYLFCSFIGNSSMACCCPFR